MIRIGGGRQRGTGSRRGLVLACMLAALSAGEPVLALQCKPKTAGYFKDFENSAPRSPVPVGAGGVARSLTGALGDPQKGRSIMVAVNKGNCIACHRVAALSGEPAHGDLGPTLNGVGARYDEAQLRQLVVDPKQFFQNTVMPAYHTSEGLTRVPAALAGQPILSATEVEDVVAFLRTLR